VQNSPRLLLSRIFTMVQTLTIPLDTVKVSALVIPPFDTRLCLRNPKTFSSPYKSIYLQSEFRLISLFAMYDFFLKLHFV